MKMVVVLAVVAAAVPVWSKEHGSSDEREAVRLSAQGIIYFRDGDYVQAIDRFKGAYAKSRRPDLLFNIAQAYRKTGQCAQALDYYQNYLEAEPAAFNRTRVEERITEMKQCSSGAVTTTMPSEGPKDDRPPAPAPPPEPSPFEQPSAERELDNTLTRPVPPPRRPMRGRTAIRIAGLASLGVGLVLGATGAYFAASAVSSSGQVSGLFRDGGQWNDEYQRIESDGRGASAGAAGLLTVGAAALIGGATLTGIGWSNPR